MIKGQITGCIKLSQRQITVITLQKENGYTITNETIKLKSQMYANLQYTTKKFNLTH